MQQIGTIGVVPQLVNPAVMVIPGKGSEETQRKRGGGCCGGSSRRKGSCNSCGRCIGSLLVMLFAFICASCCYAIPVYSAFVNPEYFKKQENPIWTWKSLFTKAKELGSSIIQPNPTDPEGEALNSNNNTGDAEGAQLHRLISVASSDDKPSSSFLNLESFLGEDAHNLMLPLYMNSHTSEANHFNTDVKSNVRGGGPPSQVKGGRAREESVGYKYSQIPSTYFDKEYCERGADGVSKGVWRELCDFKHNVTNLECIDMMNGPAICVGIREHKYEVFSVSRLCKFVEPVLPVEVFPAISYLCHDADHPNNHKAAALPNRNCPCMVTSSPVSKMNLGENVTANNPETDNFISLDKLNSDFHELLRV